MHPVEPRTMVRGPAALTINFMTRADTQPWQVRWPEVKYSWRVTFFTPLKGERTCVSLRKVAVSAIIGLRFRSSIWSRRLRPCGLRDVAPFVIHHLVATAPACGPSGNGLRPSGDVAPF